VPERLLNAFREVSRVFFSSFFLTSFFRRLLLRLPSWLRLTHPLVLPRGSADSPRGAELEPPQPVQLRSSFLRR
jgi:hypothetical protein